MKRGKGAQPRAPEPAHGTWFTRSGHGGCALFDPRADSHS